MFDEEILLETRITDTVAILLSSKQHGLLAQDTHMLQSTVLLEFEN